MRLPSVTQKQISHNEIIHDAGLPSFVLPILSIDNTDETAKSNLKSIDIVSALEYKGLAEKLHTLRVTGSPEETTRLTHTDNTATPNLLLAVGVGASLSVNNVRLAFGAAARNLLDSKEVHLDLSDARFTIELANAALEGFLFGSYHFSEYLATPKAKLESITFSAAAGVSPDVSRCLALASGLAAVKDLVNTSPSELFPASFAEIATDLGTEHGLKVTVWDEKSLESDGFGGIIGVGQGSSRPPRLVRVDYSPQGAKKHVAFVGKGITFDSGGLSLKPAASMRGMKFDMSGAAASLHAVSVLAQLGVKVRATAWLCLAENLPSGMATRPDDVLRIRGGKTVEVTNTDAEGRLVLADGLVAASEEHPDLIVDVATLTGAQIVALGDRISGLMGTDEGVSIVKSAADAVHEPLWPMPLPDELKPLLKSEVADYINAKMGGVIPGMLVAGVFLREFVGNKKEDPSVLIPWAHLDIAGPANNEGAGRGFTKPGATGAGFRTLVSVGEHLASQN